ncbi:MAG: ECF transporter S component [Bacteroidota bacterium]|nr:ECF transporter S component [Bacteroidota bacterium]
MINSLTINKAALKTKSMYTAAAIFAAVALPQLLHVVGSAVGLGPILGEVFLPMHLPVLLAGLVAGPAVGILAGIISPLISFALTGMPKETMLPFIMVELAGYGFSAGILSKTEVPSFFKLFIAQISGRILRFAAIVFAIYILGNQTVTIAKSWSFIVNGLPGILLQWALLPVFVSIINKRKGYND